MTSSNFLGSRCPIRLRPNPGKLYPYLTFGKWTHKPGTRDFETSLSALQNRVQVNDPRTSPQTLQLLEFRLFFVFHQSWHLASSRQQCVWPRIHLHCSGALEAFKPLLGNSLMRRLCLSGNRLAHSEEGQSSFSLPARMELCGVLDARLCLATQTRIPALRKLQDSNHKF